MKCRIIKICLLAWCFSMVSVTISSAQCSMCRRVAETNMESGKKQGAGLNTGILYLMSIPYVMGGVAGYIWWKNRQKSE